MAQMPQYQSHKKVWGLKIKDILTINDGSGILKFENPLFSERLVSADYMLKREPHVGGYFVQYEGGYESFSPGDEFESGNSLIQEPAEITWIQRLEIERAELQDNFDKLMDFIESSERYKQLGQKEQMLVSDQLEAMQTYGDILGIRIDAFSESTSRLAEDVAATGPAPEVQPYGHRGRPTESELNGTADDDPRTEDTVDEGDCRDLAN